jgi:hypothetical protein
MAPGVGQIGRDAGGQMIGEPFWGGLSECGSVRGQNLDGLQGFGVTAGNGPDGEFPSGDVVIV